MFGCRLNTRTNTHKRIGNIRIDCFFFIAKIIYGILIYYISCYVIKGSNSYLMISYDHFPPSLYSKVS